MHMERIKIFFYANTYFRRLFIAAMTIEEISKRDPRMELSIKFIAFAVKTRRGEFSHWMGTGFAE